MSKLECNVSTTDDVFAKVNANTRMTGAGNEVVWLGIDSLTAGAGGFSYNIPLEKFARGVVGWGGRIVPFIGTGQSLSAVFEAEGYSNSNTKLIRNLPTSADARKYSLADRGVFCDGDTAPFLNAELTPYFNWTTVDVYYLQQPSGGSFTIDRPVGTSITVDTAGSLEIKRVTIRNDKRVSTASVRCYNVDVGVGKNVVLYEALFKSGDNGTIWINTAEGGRTTKTQSGNSNEVFNQVIQKTWVDMLGVTYSVVQAGVNDASAGETPANFSTYLSDLITGSLSDTECIIVRPTQTNPAVSDMSAYTSIYESYEAIGYGYIDLVGEIGDYNYCNNAGLMIDDYHTSEDYQYLCAQIVCNKLIGRSFYVDTPPIIDYTATDTQTIISGSFKSLIL